MDYDPHVMIIVPFTLVLNYDITTHVQNLFFHVLSSSPLYVHMAIVEILRLHLICWSCCPGTKWSWYWNTALHWMLNVCLSAQLQSKERWIMSQDSNVMPLCHFSRQDVVKKQRFRCLHQKILSEWPFEILSWSFWMHSFKVTCH